jgi:predicted metal-dependent hydrolase
LNAPRAAQRHVVDAAPPVEWQPMARSGAADDPLQLSLFDAMPPVADAPPALPPGRPRSARPGTPPAPAAPPGAALPEPSLPRARPPRAGDPILPAEPERRPELAPLRFRHPQSDREVQLGEHRVGYVLRRVRRRSIGFIVSAEGLAVNAPRWVSLQNIEAAVQAKGDWILRKLHEQQERARRVEAARIEWHDGTSLPFLGETVIIVLDPRVAGAVLNTDADALPGVPRLTLHVGLPHNAGPEQIRDVVQSWLQRQALRVFTERCQHFATSLGVKMRRLSLSAAQTRWGSASADGSIRLNWRLVHFGMQVIDYVVAHELAHLREMNHSAAFWDVVRSVVPDYQRMRDTLKDVPVPVLG